MERMDLSLGIAIKEQYEEWLKDSHIGKSNRQKAGMQGERGSTMARSVIQTEIITAPSTKRATAGDSNNSFQDQANNREKVIYVGIQTSSEGYGQTTRRHDQNQRVQKVIISDSKTIGERKDRMILWTEEFLEENSVMDKISKATGSKGLEINCK